MKAIRMDWWPKIVNRLWLLGQLQSLSDAWLFVRIFCFAAAVPLLMRLKLPRLAQILGPPLLALSPPPTRVQQIIRLVDLALQIGRPLIRPQCLTRGLTLYYFLNRAGFDVALAFGAGKVADNFAAHCWLVKNGEPFLETADPQTAFATLYVLPNPSHSP